MLLEFQCSNYKSIKNPINFSLLASKDTTHKTLLKTYKNHKILRSAVIYGATSPCFAYSLYSSRSIRL